jgi:hypothetical protein
MKQRNFYSGVRAIVEGRFRETTSKRLPRELAYRPEQFPRLAKSGCFASFCVREGAVKRLKPKVMFAAVKLENRTAPWNP